MRNPVCMLPLAMVLSAGALAQVPDLSGFDLDTRTSIQLACARAKADGPAPYRACVLEHLESIEGKGDMPDLSLLDLDTHTSIQLACARDKAEGPAAYRDCVRRQLASIEGLTDATGLPELDQGPTQSREDNLADDAWELSIEGADTPFESRWATADPLIDESSAEAELAFAGVNAGEKGLELFIADPYSTAEVLLSALAGEEIECSFDNWRLAVDRQEFRVADTDRSTDNSATFLQPQDAKSFWQAFGQGSLLAVQVERTCYGDMDVITIVYSLAGSQAAVDFVLK